jgi:hypothetical protein
MKCKVSDNCSCDAEWGRMERITASIARLYDEGEMTRAAALELSIDVGHCMYFILACEAEHSNDPGVSGVARLVMAHRFYRKIGAAPPIEKGAS